MDFFYLLLSKINNKPFDIPAYLYSGLLNKTVEVRTELEIRNAGDLVSSSMGTKTNDGVVIYGIGYDKSSIGGIFYSGYLISKDKNAVLTSKTTYASSITYNNEEWYYSYYRTTNARDTYEDGIIVPYYVGKLDGVNAVTAILDYYFMKT